MYIITVRSRCIYIFILFRIAVGFQPLSRMRRTDMIEEGTVVYYLDEDLVHWAGDRCDPCQRWIYSALTAEPVKGRM